MPIFHRIFLVVCAATWCMGTWCTGSVFASIIPNPPMPISKRLTVQPIMLADTNGSNQAHFFGSAPHQAVIQGMVDKIWRQAGIDIDWLAPKVWKNTQYNNTFTDNPPSLAIVNAAQAAGVALPNSDPNSSKVLNAYFMRSVNGVIPISTKTKGTAYANSSTTHFNGTFQALGSQTVSNPAHYEPAARLVSHEMGHNLALGHSTNNTHLMLSSANSTSQERLTPNDITTVRNSGFLTEYFPGDFNGDKAVNGADFLIWKNGFAGSTANGDADEDGDVDGADFLTMQRNLQQAPSLLANTLAVPEPSSLVLATPFLALLGFRKRR